MGEQFPQSPYVIRDARFKGGRNAKRRMDAAEIVVREIQGTSVFQIVELLGIGIRQASEAAKGHANREVAALHIAGGDVTRIRPTVPNFYYRLYHWRRRVSPCRIVLAVIAVYFY